MKNVGRNLKTLPNFHDIITMNMDINSSLKIEAKNSYKFEEKILINLFSAFKSRRRQECFLSGTLW